MFLPADDSQSPQDAVTESSLQNGGESSQSGNYMHFSLINTENKCLSVDFTSLNLKISQAA